MVASAPTRQRVAGPERWAKALERAVAAGVEPLQIAGSGEWVCTSASRLNVVYRTDGVACECEAAFAGDPVCCHRAAVRYALGWWLSPDGWRKGPEPTPPAPATTVVYDILVGGAGYRTFGSREEAEAEAAKFSRWKSTSVSVVIVEREIPAAIVLPPRVADPAPTLAA